MEEYIVYVKTNADGFIVDIGSSGFIRSTEGWTEIDSGVGDRFYHAQNHYLPECFITESGVWRYKLENGTARECTAEEIAEQEAALPEPYDEIADMQEALNALGVNVNG